MAVAPPLESSSNARGLWNHAFGRCAGSVRVVFDQAQKGQARDTSVRIRSRTGNQRTTCLRWKGQTRYKVAGAPNNLYHKPVKLALMGIKIRLSSLSRIALPRLMSAFHFPFDYNRHHHPCDPAIHFGRDVKRKTSNLFWTESFGLGEIAGIWRSRTGFSF